MNSALFTKQLNIYIISANKQPITYI